jgi:hypothetical protein
VYIAKRLKYGSGTDTDVAHLAAQREDRGRFAVKKASGTGMFGAG